MRRHRVVLLAIAAIVVAGFVPAWVGATGLGPVSHGMARAAFSSGGLGLKLSAWEAIYGPGKPGQSFLSYTLDDGVYNVGIDGASRKIFFIERTWDDPAGVPLDQALAEAQQLIPADAKLTEYYNAASVKIAYGTDIDRFSSKTLAKEVRGTDRNLTGYFTAVYDKIPSQTTYGSNAVRLVLVIGTKNPNIG